LPAEIVDGFKLVLGIAFRPGEFVSLSECETDQNGDRHPGRGQTLKQEDLLAQIAGKSIAQIYTSADGVFLRINPMKAGGKKDEDVTNYRHCLIEFDLDQNGNRIPKEAQYAALIGSGLPFVAILDSGDKSIHGWCRLDAGSDFELYKKRRDEAYAKLAGTGWPFDPKNKNPSRYSRCPDCPRKLYDATGTVIGTGRQGIACYQRRAGKLDRVRS